MSEYLIGLDIGSSKVCAAVGKLDKNGQLQIVGLTSANCTGIKKAVVIDIESTSEAINNCIEQLQRMVDIKIDKVYLSLPASVSTLINSKGVIAISSDDREIKDSDVDRVLDASKIISISSDKEIVGVVPKQFIVDGYDNVKDPVGMCGSRLEVDAQVVVAQATVMNNLLKSIAKCGLSVEGIVLQPLAISEVVLKKEEKDMGVAVVDVGSETTDISVFKNGSLSYVDMIPVGGNSITNDISLCVNIPFSDAEMLKLKYGNISRSRENFDENIKVQTAYNNVVEVSYTMLNQIIEARVEETLAFVLEKLKKSGYYSEISGIVLVGGGIALLRGIGDLSRDIFEKPVKIGSPEYVGTASPIYVTAVGIVKDVSNNIKTNDSDKEEENELLLKKKRTRHEEDDENNEGFFTKIKQFFGEFF